MSSAIPLIHRNRRTRTGAYPRWCSRKQGKEEPSLIPPV